MNIIIIYPNSLAKSSAATNRIISLALGLIYAGNNVKVFINRPTERKSNPLNIGHEGEYYGVHYEYATQNIIWYENPIKKAWSLYWGLFRTILKILKESRKKKIDIVISAATYGFIENLIYHLFTKLNKTKLVYTIDEYPWVNISKERYSAIYRQFYLKHFYKLFDSYIVMTHTLLEYYKSLSSQNANFVHIPMTVEIERFEISVAPTEEDYIAYCGGDTTGMKDGIDHLVNAFYLIKDDFPDLRLYIAGPVHSSIHRLVDLLQLNSRVRLFDFVVRDKVPELLLNAKALCLARPNNLQAEGGFPTKLGEYLATGNPVIATKVGEIPLYLEDQVNSFLAEPGDVEDFAKKIRYVMQNPEIAKKIGLKGKELAKTHFDFHKQGMILSNFLRETL